MGGFSGTAGPFADDATCEKWRQDYILSSTCSCGGTPGGQNTSTPTLTSLVVSPGSPTLAIGHTQQFTATASYSDGSTKDVTASATWTSSAANVASIGSGGLATGLATGSTTMRASYGGSSGSTSLTVTPDFSIASFSPGGGAPGTSIIISGANFPSAPGAVSVNVCGNAVTVASASSTQLVVTAPTPSAGASTAVSATVACTISVTASEGTVTAPVPFQVVLSRVPSVYFVDGYQSAVASVKAVAKSGGAVSTLASDSYVTAIAATPWAVYWVWYYMQDRIGASSYFQGTVSMVPAGGGSATTLASLPPVSALPAASGLTVDAAGNVFFGTDGVYEVAPGAAPVQLAKALSGGRVTALTIHGGTLYWGETLSGSQGAIRAIPAGGGTPTTLSTGYGAVTAIAADDASVYYTAGQVYKVPVSGGTPTPLTTASVAGVTQVALDASYFYWAQGSYVYRVAIGGGTPTQFVSSTGSVSGVAVDATQVYWTSGTAVNATPRAGGSTTTIASGVWTGPIFVTP